MGLFRALAERIRPARAHSAPISDLAIAEGLARIAVDETRTLYRDLTSQATEAQSADPIEVLLFTILYAAHAHRAHRGTTATALDPIRLRRVEERAATIAIAQFVHSAPLRPGADLDRLKADLLRECLQRAPSLMADYVKLDEHVGAGNKDALYSFTLLVAARLAGESAIEHADPDALLRLMQSIGGSWSRTKQAVTRIEREASADPVDPTPGIHLALPETWRLRASDPCWSYGDLSSPQYNFLLSLLAPTPEAIDDSLPPTAVLEALLARNPMAADGDFVSLGPSRALAQYRSATTEHGRRKDDRHWWLIETSAKPVRLAVFTLSVLADQANEEATDALAVDLRRAITSAEFVAPQSR